MTGTQVGTIVNVNDRGFGFVKLEGYDQNVFFHAKDVRHIEFEKLRKGDTVSVDTVEKSEKGYVANHVYLIS